MIKHNSSNISKQNGVALVVSMILLTIITMLSISAMHNTNLDTKIAVNHQLKEFSFQAAENALSIITGPDLDNLNLSIPARVDDAPITNNDYFTSRGVENQPDISADVTMDYQAIIDPKAGSGNILFSGFQMDTVTHLFLADSVGEVEGSGTNTHNRMQVALIRQ